MIVVLNLGDSRAVGSKKGGNEVVEMSKDHKPTNLIELSRIVQHNGKLIRDSFNIKTRENTFHFAKTCQHVREINLIQKKDRNSKFSPWRIYPGGLTVSRSLGDPSSKLPELGGLDNIVLSEPDVFDFESDGFDFIVLACYLIS